MSVVLVLYMDPESEVNFNQFVRNMSVKMRFHGT